MITVYDTGMGEEDTFSDDVESLKTRILQASTPETARQEFSTILTLILKDSSRV